MRAVPLSDRVAGAGGRKPIEPGGGRALLLVGAGLVVAGMLFPWGVVGLALEIGAIVLGVRTMRRAAASGRPAPGALAAVVAGSVASVLLVGLLGFLTLVYKEYQAYTTCFGRAITESAKADCRTTFEFQVRSRFGL